MKTETSINKVDHEYISEGNHFNTLGFRLDILGERFQELGILVRSALQVVKSTTPSYYLLISNVALYQTFT